MSIGANTNLICQECGKKLEIREGDSEESGTSETYTKHCAYCNQILFCPDCDNKLEVIDQYPFALGIIQKCGKCGTIFHRSKCGGKYMSIAFVTRSKRTER